MGIALFVSSLLSLTFLSPSVSDDSNLPEADEPLVDYGTRAGGNWLTGWDYRKSHNITGATGAGTDYPEKVIAYYDGLGNLFYETTDRTATISGDPTDTHGFHPAHKTNISAVNKVVDGSSRTYLGYDSNDTGAEIRLYYTDDLNGTWTGYSGNPILGPNDNWYRTPSVAYDGTTFHMFVSNRTASDIERWTSTDGITFTNQEVVVSTTSQWGKGFITYNTDESKWFLYYIDIIATVKKTYLRTATDIADLDSASPSLVYDGHGFWSVTEKDGIYWATAEAGPAPVWTVTTFNSTSPDSGFTETDNSPVLVEDEACPRFLLSPDGSVGYLYSNRIDPTWYQDTRKAIWNMVDLEAHSDTDFDDVRFTDDDGDTELDYWMEDKTDSDHAVFWAEVADDLGSNQTIYIYYGKTGETTTSNGNNTFLLFDHFLGTGLDGGTWTSSGIVSVAASIVTAVDPDTGTAGLFYSTSTFGAYNVSLRSRGKIYNVHYVAYGLRTTGSPIDMATFDNVGAGNNQLRTSNEGSTTTTTIANDPYWVVMELYWISGSVKFLKNDTIIARHTTNIPDEAIPVRTAAQRSVGGTTARIDIDWLFVRKYVDSEPWHGAWGSEETPSCPTTIYSIATGDWKTAGTWKDSCIPGTGDTAIICDGDIVTMDDNRAAANVTVNSTATLNLSASTTLTLDAGANVTISGLLNMTGANLTVGSGYFDFYNTGDIWLNDSTVDSADLVLTFSFNIGSATNSTLNNYTIADGQDVLIAISSETYTVKDSGIVWHMNATLTSCASCFETVDFVFGNLTTGEDYRLYNGRVLVGTQTANATGLVFFSTLITDSGNHLNLTYYTAAPPGPSDIPGAGIMTGIGAVFDCIINHWKDTIECRAKILGNSEGRGMTITYYWLFSDNSTSNERYPTKSFEYGGITANTSATLIVCNGKVCSHPIQESVHLIRWWLIVLILATIITPVVIGTWQIDKRWGS